MDILSLGEKIKRLRKERNMTLKELAGDRITAAQISHIERDKSNTSHELLEYLSHQLEVSIDYLLETKEMHIMIHTIKGFGIVYKAEIDVFMELSCFFDDPEDVGNLISGFG